MICIKPYTPFSCFTEKQMLSIYIYERGREGEAEGGYSHSVMGLCLFALKCQVLASANRKENCLNSAVFQLNRTVEWILLEGNKTCDNEE